MSRQAQKLFRVAARSQNWQRGASTSIRPYSSDNKGSVADPGYGTPKSPAPTSTAKPSATSDPFPLPFDPRLQGLSLASEHQSEGLSANGVALNGEEPIPLRVPGRELGMETRDVKVARLIYQARKRGTLETDLLLSTFAKDHLRSLSDGEVDEFDRVCRLVIMLTSRMIVDRQILCSSSSSSSTSSCPSFPSSSTHFYRRSFSMSQIGTSSTG